RSRDIQMRRFTPANYFHMHPSVCSLEWEPRPEILIVRLFARHLVPLHGASAGKEPRVGAEDRTNPRNRRIRREKEPLVTSLAKTLVGKAQLQCKPPCKFESVQSPMVAVLTYQKPQ